MFSVRRCLWEVVFGLMFMRLCLGCFVWGHGSCLNGLKVIVRKVFGGWKFSTTGLKNGIGSEERFCDGRSSIISWAILKSPAFWLLGWFFVICRFADFSFWVSVSDVHTFRGECGIEMLLCTSQCTNAPWVCMMFWCRDFCMYEIVF